MDPAHDVATRENLYKDFIEEASALYADALEHADKTMQAIIDTYLRPNITLRDLSATLRNKHAMDPLREFSEACREELRKLELSGPSTTRR